MVSLLWKPGSLPPLDIEEVLSGTGGDQLHVMVADVIKSIFDCALGRLGLPDWFRKVFFSFHSQAVRLVWSLLWLFLFLGVVIRMLCRAHGVGRSPAPLCIERCRACDARRFTMPEDGQLQGGFGVLRFDRRRHRRVAACQPGRAAGATGAEPMLETFVPAPVPVPQPVDQLEDVPKIVDYSVPEQVIEVPKISCPVQPSRAVLPATQMAGQLVEVPWVSPSSVLVPQLAEESEEEPRRALFVGRDGQEWRRLTRPTGVYFWRVGTPHIQSAFSREYIAGPGRFSNTGHRLTTSL